MRRNTEEVGGRRRNEEIKDRRWISFSINRAT